MGLLRKFSVLNRKRLTRARLCNDDVDCSGAGYTRRAYSSDRLVVHNHLKTVGLKRFAALGANKNHLFLRNNVLPQVVGERVDAGKSPGASHSFVTA